MANLKVYEVNDGGECVWAITDDPEKARAISREYLRGDSTPEDMGLDPEDSEESITELPMNYPLRITDEDEGGERTLTCAEWIEREGEGFLCTTCF